MSCDQVLLFQGEVAARLAGITSLPVCKQNIAASLRAIWCGRPGRKLGADYCMQQHGAVAVAAGPHHDQVGQARTR
jgi:hypothetical protein